MAEVINMADIKSDNRLISPIQSIRSAADEAELRVGTENAVTQSMVILLGGADDDYPFDYFVSNMKRSEMIAALEIIKGYLMLPLITQD